MKKIFQIFRTWAHRVFLSVMIIIIAFQVHWSAVLLLAWICISMWVFACQINDNEKDLRGALKAVNDERKRDRDNFNKFIATINSQAAAIKKEMNVCRECQMHPTGIRPGSMHNRKAPNCLMGSDEKVS